MRGEKGLLIDLDGTLADTMSQLYIVYEDFLAQFGIPPSLEEFDTLNGLKLVVIAKQLKETHNLKPSETELFQDYLQKIMHALGNSPVMPGGEEFLYHAQEVGYSIALVTSGPRALANNFLSRHNLQRFFDVTITADDVTQGKPHPEPYELAIARLGLSSANCIAIEDSPLGMESATAAGARVLFFKSWEEIRQQLPERYEITPLHANFRIRAIEPEPVTPLALKEIDVIWNQECQKKPSLFNGRVFSVREMNEELCVGEFIDYKIMYVTQRYPEYQHLFPHILPIGVSGLTRYLSYVLLGQRAEIVHHYPLCLELVPSGTLDSHVLRGEEVDFKEALLKELEEEGGISREYVLAIKPLFIAKDSWMQHADICLLIELNSEFEQPQIQHNPEYVEVYWKTVPEATALLQGSKDTVPLSRLILKRLSI